MAERQESNSSISHKCVNLWTGKSRHFANPATWIAKQKISYFST